MRRVGRRVEQADRDRLRTRGLELSQHGRRPIEVQRLELIPVGADAAGDLTRRVKKRTRLPDLEIEDSWTVLVADQQQVCESRGGENGCPGALSLEQRVGSARGPQPQVNLAEVLIQPKAHQRAHAQ